MGLVPLTEPLQARGNEADEHIFAVPVFFACFRITSACCCILYAKSFMSLFRLPYTEGRLFYPWHFADAERSDKSPLLVAFICTATLSTFFQKFLSLFKRMVALVNTAVIPSCPVCFARGQILLPSHVPWPSMVLAVGKIVRNGKISTKQ